MAEYQGNLQITKAIIKSLLITEVNPITVEQLNNNFKSLEGHNIPYQMFGFTNLNAFLQYMPDVLKINILGDTSTVTIVPSKNKNHIREMILSDKKQSEKKRDRSHNYFTNRQNKKINFDSSNSTNKALKELRKINLDCETPAVKMLDLQVSTKNLSLNDRNTERNTYDLTDTKNVINPLNNKKSDSSLSKIDSKSIDNLKDAVPTEALDKLVFSIDVPEDFVTFGNLIPECDLASEVLEKDVILIRIQKIDNPSNFWFNLQKKFIDFTKHFNSFYRNCISDNRYNINPKQIFTGLHCAAFYRNNWNRGIVLDKRNDNYVKMKFVDLELVALVSMECIKYLSKRFVTAPKYSIKGSLSFIKPLEDYWSSEAINSFSILSLQILVYGKITKIDLEEKVVHMIVGDTNKKEPVNVNCTLLNQGFAVATKSLSEINESL